LGLEWYQGSTREAMKKGLKLQVLLKMGWKERRVLLGQEPVDRY
jgi:hypothetical protein